MIWKAIKTSAGLGALFMGVYLACNYLTSLRTDVDVFYMDWEKEIPFVPHLFIPYLSIDLFFLAAPFFCGTPRELKVLAWRIAACILAAGACFLVFPMKFAFERPAAEGFLGQLFESFRNVDMPFNQFPSLHIALLTILWGHYHRHSWTWIKPLLYLWFMLVGVSTMLVYQHHFIDVLGGVVLGVTCMFAVPADPQPRRFTPNRRVATWYLLGMFSLMTAATLLRPWGVLLLWPAFGCGMMAAAYLWVGPAIYQKKNGRLGVITWISLWPVLVGQWLSLQYYARRCRLWDSLTEKVWIGRQLPQFQAGNAIYSGVRAVLDLTGEFTEAATFRKTVYLQLAILDLTAPTQDQLDEAVDFIERQSRHGIVYVHCKVGYSRTAAVAGAYLLKSGKSESLEQAIEKLRQARRGITIRPEAMKALEAYATRLKQGREVVAV